MMLDHIPPFLGNQVVSLVEHLNHAFSLERTAILPRRSIEAIFGQTIYDLQKHIDIVEERKAAEELLEDEVNDNILREELLDERDDKNNFLLLQHHSKNSPKKSDSQTAADSTPESAALRAAVKSTVYSIASDDADMSRNILEKEGVNYSSFIMKQTDDGTNDMHSADMNGYLKRKKFAEKKSENAFASGKKSSRKRLSVTFADRYRLGCGDSHIYMNTLNSQVISHPYRFAQDGHSGYMTKAETKAKFTETYVGPGDYYRKEQGFIGDGFSNIADLKEIPTTPGTDRVLDLTI